jgi:hypothetical protein
MNSNAGQNMKKTGKIVIPLNFSKAKNEKRRISWNFPTSKNRSQVKSNSISARS